MAQKKAQIGILIVILAIVALFLMFCNYYNKRYSHKDRYYGIDIHTSKKYDMTEASKFSNFVMVQTSPDEMVRYKLIEIDDATASHSLLGEN